MRGAIGVAQRTAGRPTGEIGSGAIFEAPALVAGLDDVAMMGEAVEERGRHLGVAEHARPLAESEVGGDDVRSLPLEPADQVEEELSARLREGQVAELVQDHEVNESEETGDAALAGGPGLALERVAIGIDHPAPSRSR